MTVGDIDYFINPWWVTRHDMVRWQMSDRKFRDPWKLLDMPVRTLAYIGREPGTKEVEAAFPMLKLPLFSSREGADIIEKDASKAEGLKRLCKAWNIPLKNTIAFGDSMNDYEIVTTAGIGVAMGNGHPQLEGGSRLRYRAHWRGRCL
ncbi:MAG: HAD hydrolase family protein [Clostridium sp.]